MSVAEKKKYPKALPHRSPDAVADEIARWRSRTYFLVWGLAMLSALTAAITVFAIKKARASSHSPSSVAEQDSLKLTLEDAVPMLQPERTLETKREFAEKERFLETLGSLSAAHLFQCYLNIGLLADGLESEAYTLEEADATLHSIADVMDQVDGQLEQLARSKLAPEDRAAIGQIKAATALLGIQAHLLKQYWISGDPEDAQRYHEARNAAWKGVNKILTTDEHR